MKPLLTPPPDAGKIRRVTWSVGRICYGTGSVEKQPYWAGKPGFPPSRILVCPKCGEAWGRIEVDGVSFLPLPRHCPEHGGGSLLLADAKYNYPPMVIRASLKTGHDFLTLFPIHNGAYDAYFSFRH